MGVRMCVCLLNSKEVIVCKREKTVTQEPINGNFDGSDHRRHIHTTSKMLCLPLHNVCVCVLKWIETLIRIGHVGNSGMRIRWKLGNRADILSSSSWHVMIMPVDSCGNYVLWSLQITSKRYCNIPLLPICPVWVSGISFFCEKCDSFTTHRMVGVVSNR